LKYTKASVIPCRPVHRGGPALQVGLLVALVAQPEVGVVGRDSTGVDIFSLSAMQSATCFSRSASKISSSCHDACRNSKAARVPLGQQVQEGAEDAASFRKFGGSWKRRTPSFGPSARAARQNAWICPRTAAASRRA
jgi:hypothetical protein